MSALWHASPRPIFGEVSPLDRLAAYVDLDEYGLLHQAARWARGEDVVTGGPAPVTPGDHHVSRAVADTWQSILLRRPNWRSEAEVRAEYEAGNEPSSLIASLGHAEPGRVAIDLAIIDARPTGSLDAEPRLAIVPPVEEDAGADPVPAGTLGATADGAGDGA